MTPPFVNRLRELAELERWWDEPGGVIALVWGRRRVGKTALVARFAESRRTIFHTAAGRPDDEELRAMSHATAAAIGSNLALRDLAARPFADWDDALEFLAAAAESEPLLVVLDEFPELLGARPDLDNRIRAFWDRARTRTKLRLLICGSAARTMQRIQDERAPLYGRIDLTLQIHPFEPNEAALMLPGLSAADRALVWGLVGGIPLYLSWWDASRSVEENVGRLVCAPGARLLTAGELILATDLDPGDLTRRVLLAIAGGKTRFSEIRDAVHTDPTRTLDRLAELRIVERLTPVTATERTRVAFWRIADNFLAFWLGVANPYRGEIDRGLGASILPVMMQRLDVALGPRFEEAFRSHLRRLAVAGELGPDVVAVGSYWREGPRPVEVDAVVVAGRSRDVVMVGEAKWARVADGTRIASFLRAVAADLASPDRSPRLAIAAREEVRGAPDDVLVVTAQDIFGT